MRILRYLLFVLAVSLANAQTGPQGQVLHNAITLPAAWPPQRPLSLASQVPPYLVLPPALIPIDVGRQLFVDDFLIESSTLTRTNHRAVVQPQPVLVPVQGDGTWAAPFSDGVWFDPADNLYKLFYMGGNGSTVSYAYSTNGRNWVRPALPNGPVPNTNIVIQTGGGRDSGTIWMDLSETNPARKFKAFIYAGGARQNVHFSPDGINWTLQPTQLYSVADRTTFFRNVFRQIWVKSARSHELIASTIPQRPTEVQRSRAYSESPDLINWTPAERYESFWWAADDLDPAYPATTAYPELYNLDAVSYESLIVGLFSLYYPAPAGPDLVELGVGFSRDGYYWSRPLRGAGPGQAFIQASGVPGSWNGFNTQSAGGGFLIVGDELWFYFSARNAPHGTPPTQISTGVATLRRDGFASLDAGTVEGSITTRPVRFNGNQLYVNVDAPAGALQVEALDASGNVIAPYTRANSVVIQANQTKRQVTWTGVSNLAALTGRPVKFRFYLRNGKLYSFWVTSSPTGASNGAVAAGGPGFTGVFDKDNTANQADTTPPLRLSGQPSGSLPNTVSSVTLSVFTDEPAACRYSTVANQSFSAMSSVLVAQGGQTSHSTQLPITQSTSAATYSYYVRCKDPAGNVNPDDFTIGFTVAAPDPTQGVSILRVWPSNVYGGQVANGNRVTLISAAPAGGATVSLASSNPQVASLPPFVSVQAGNNLSTTFLIDTVPVSVATPVRITATYAGVAVTTTLTVEPYPELNALLVSNTNVKGGQPIQADVNLTNNAAGPSVVNLVSSHPSVLPVPATVTVPDGTVAAPTFVLNTTPVTSAVNVTITATRRTVTKTVGVVVTASLALSTLTATPLDPYLGSAPGLGTVTLTGPAPAPGVSVTLASDNSAAASVPGSLTIPANATSATFPITVGTATADTAVNITANYAGVTLGAPITVKVPPVLQSVTLGSSSILAGTAVIGSQVSITQKAPAAGVIVQLSSNNSAKVTIPPTVVIPAGSTSAPFSLTTNTVTTDTPVIVTAVFAGVTKTANLNLIAPAVLTTLKLGQTSGIGPLAVTGSDVTLSSAAPPGGALVTLTSSNTQAATVPASVTVPAGATTSTFLITVLATATDTTTTITASYGGVSRSLDFVAQSPAALTTLALGQNTAIGGASISGSSVTLSRVAGPGGTTVTLQSSDSGAATVPGHVVVPAGAASAPFSITTLAVNSNTPVVITASLGGVNKTASLTVSATTALNTLSLGQLAVTGGGAVAGSTVTLTHPAPGGGAVVHLKSSNPLVASLPATVPFPAGSQSISFPIQTVVVPQTAQITIEASFGGVIRQSTLDVLPVLRPLSVTLTQSSVAGGQPVPGNLVTLNLPAPSGGVIVQLTSNNPLVTVPGQLTIPPGATTGTFLIQTAPGATQITAGIKAGVGANSAAASLIVTPPPSLQSLAVAATSVGPGTVLPGNLISLSAVAPAGGLVVALSSSRPSQLQVPASVAVPAGASSVPFAITAIGGSGDTSATITASLNGLNRSASLSLVTNVVYDLRLAVASTVAGTGFGGNRVYLNHPAVSGGTLVTLSSSNPAVVIPPSVVVPAGATYFDFAVSTQQVAPGFVAQIVASAGGRSRTANLTVTAASLAGLTAGSASVTGGNPIPVSQLKLTQASPAGGINVLLSSSDPTVLSVPPSVTIPAGQTVGLFAIGTRWVPANKLVTITASYAGVTRTVQVSLVAATLRSFGLSAWSVRGPNTTTASIQLSVAAPVGGLTVTLQSSLPALAGVPPTILIPAGAQRISFAIPVGAVTARTTVTLQAGLGGVSQSAALTVTP